MSRLLGSTLTHFKFPNPRLSSWQCFWIGSLGKRGKSLTLSFGLSRWCGIFATDADASDLQPNLWMNAVPLLGAIFLGPNKNIWIYLGLNKNPSKMWFSHRISATTNKDFCLGWWHFMIACSSSSKALNGAVGIVTRISGWMTPWRRRDCDVVPLPMKVAVFDA